jgi:hypothetical protein
MPEFIGQRTEVFEFGRQNAEKRIADFGFGNVAVFNKSEIHNPFFPTSVSLAAA